MAKNCACSFVLISNFLTLGMLLLNVGFSTQSILSLNRRIDGDSFQVKTTAFCTKNICEKFNADLTTSGLGSSCMCRCAGTILHRTRTFYDKVSRCRGDNAIASDNSCTVTAKDQGSSTSSRLLAIDSNMTKTKEIKLDNIPKECRSIKVSWSYYKNKTWVPGEKNIFSAISKTDSILALGKKIWFLQISSNFPKTINGLLVKVTLQYVYDDNFNPKHCIMFKVLGEYKVVTPTLSPSSATTVITETTSSPVTRYKPSTDTNEVSYSTLPTISTPTGEPATTIAINPSKDTSKQDDQRLLIAFATGGVTLLITILLICLGVCIYIRRKRKSKAKKASMTRSRPAVPLPPTSPPHNYEYVVYPELNENVPNVNSIDNASYGRGPDNELIIRTPAISIESLISKHTNSSKSNHSIVSATLMTHGYTHLQDQDKSNNESNSIYQPLIRPQASFDKNDNETPCTPQEEESPTGYIEPRNNAAPEYMELEPIESEV